MYGFYFHLITLLLLLLLFMSKARRVMKKGIFNKREAKRIAERKKKATLGNTFQRSCTFNVHKHI